MRELLGVRAHGIACDGNSGAKRLRISDAPHEPERGHRI